MTIRYCFVIRTSSFSALRWSCSPQSGSLVVPLTPQEEQHLQLLAIFHYIVGGLAAFFACFPLIHLTIGVVMVCGGFSGIKRRPPLSVGCSSFWAAAFLLPGKVSPSASLSQDDFSPGADVISSSLLSRFANVCLCRSEQCWASLRSFCCRASR